MKTDMAWLEVHQQLERHPKTAALADAMSWEIDQTMGKLLRFWFWVLDFAPDGDLRKFNDAAVGRSVGLTGDAAKQFVESMVQSRWIDRAENVFRVHDWLDYAGRYLKDSKFKRDAARWQSALAVYNQAIPDSPPTLQGLSADSPQTVRRQSATTVPDLTRPNLTKPNNGEFEGFSGVESPPKAPKIELSTYARVALHYLNEKAGRDFREIGDHLGLIEARLKGEGVTIEGVKKMIDRQVAWWGRDEKMVQHLTPQTLFAKANFAKYYDTRDLSVPKDTNAKPNPRNQGTTGDGEERSRRIAATVAKRQTPT